MNRRILVISLILAIFTDIGAYLDSLFYQWMSRNSPLKYQFRPMNFYDIVTGLVFSLFLYLILVSLYYSYLRPVKKIKSSPSLEGFRVNNKIGTKNDEGCNPEVSKGLNSDKIGGNSNGNKE